MSTVDVVGGAFRRRVSFRQAIMEAAGKAGASVSDRRSLRIGLIFRPFAAAAAENQVVEAGIAMGAIPMESRGDIARDWTNFLDWIIENWDEILKMIMAIISLFA